MTLALACSLAVPLAQAEEGDADQLVASKRQADMTYRQLMEVMGASLAMIQEGIVRENAELTKTAADMILKHPAPNHKPWTIMTDADQAAFKQSLLSYDKVLDSEATRITEAAAAGDWLGASQSAYALTNACITCHVMWKNKAKP
ncbi:hypothetical protein [Thiocystis violacea]|uniref:hypothetical protein n=1 Tax=Thiocystis violacea TaxID=13725 RepID=UPI001903CB03|nr:hypothetical protein [Thiocystis violacea]MBK1716783.1 hypothetical protein [Thiocystis violacea]